MLERIHLRVIATISRRSKRNVNFICAFIVCFHCWLDYITGDYSLIIIYLVFLLIMSMMFSALKSRL